MIPLQPWMIKGGAGVLFLSAVFYAGCHTQKKLDQARLLKLESNYDRCVGIVDTFQDNVDVLEKGIKDQNAAIEKLGTESAKKMADLQASHQKAVETLRRQYDQSIAGQKEEAEKLRERLVGLSDAEACREAMKELGRKNGQPTP